MGARPYHKRYHSDALAGFMSLTLEERGAYQTILDLIYDRGGPIADNERLLAGYMGCSVRKWRSLRDQLIAKGKIHLTAEREISNSRAEKELENDAKTSRKRAENGLSGGRKKAENAKKSNENNASKLANAKQKSSQSRVPEAIVRNTIPKPLSLDQPIPDGVSQVMEAGGFVSPPSDARLLRQWLDEGADLERDVLPIVRRVGTQVRERTGRAPFKFKLFDEEVRRKVAEDRAEIEKLERIAHRYQAEGVS